MRRFVNKLSKRAVRVFGCFLLITMMSLVGIESIHNEPRPTSESVTMSRMMSVAEEVTPRNPSSLRGLVEELLTLIPEGAPDTDYDNLPDQVEVIIGTNASLNDTDFDTLNDYFEVFEGSDPLELDTNFDGLTDRREFSVNEDDIDSDGISNVWDRDNDDDGVEDEIDEDPFRKSAITNQFDMNLQLSGVPTYVTFQLRPESPEHLKLMDQFWDWPYDTTGAMQDHDNSTEDVKVIPLLNITLNEPPNQSLVDDYGMTVTPTGVHLPLVPVVHYDNVVAFSAKFYYPAVAPLNLSMNIQLIWNVLGFTDLKAVTIQSSVGRNVSLNEMGLAFVNETHSEPYSFQIINYGENQIALKVANGKYLSVGDSGVIAATSTGIGQREVFNISTPEGEQLNYSSIQLQGYDGGYVFIGTGGILFANASENEGREFSFLDMGYLPETSLLVTYNENFMLTGFAVEEFHNSSICLFYSDNRNSTIRANMLLPYVFLHNSTNHLSNIPSLLGDYGVNVQSMYTSYSHRDAVLVNMSNNMIPDVLKNLPDNQNYPIIISTEDEIKVAEMSSISPETYLVQSPANLSILNSELVTMKSTKTVFYNTSRSTALSLEDVFEELDSWNLSNNATETLFTMMLRWHAGEQTIHSASQPITSFTLENDLVDTLGDIGIYGLESMGVIKGMVSSWKAWKWVRAMRAKSMLSAYAKWKFQKVSAFAHWVRAVRHLDELDDTLKFANSAKKLDKILLIVGIIIDVGLSIVGAILLADSVGGTYGVKLGITCGVISIAVALAATALLYAIAMIPYVGWAIALGLVIADMFGGYSQQLIEFLMSVFADVSVTSKVEPEFDTQSIDVSIEDKDNNGNDVGDRINVYARVIASLTAYGSDGDQGIHNSYSRPYISIIPPWGQNLPQEWQDYIALTSSSGADYVTSVPEKVLLQDLGLIKIYCYKSQTTSTSSAWIEPKIGMPNYPVSVHLNPDTYLYNKYKTSWFFGLDVDYHENPIYVSESFEFVTFYYDIMPSSISRFAEWRYITPLDHDHDGLKDTEELGDMVWKYDYDQDGLNDRHETTIGTDPRNADSDSDGLLDGWELKYGTDPNDRDSDGDGLRDLREIAGWEVNFEFNSTPFRVHVYSDPRLPDSNDDGINDYDEYWGNTNPRSYDTNGDGVWDSGTPAVEYELDYEGEWSEEGLNLYYSDIVTDEEGFVYVLMNDGNYPSDWNHHNYFPSATKWWITKLDSELENVPTGSLFESLPGHTYFQHNLMIDKPNETIYLQGDTEGWSYAPDEIWAYNLNGTINYRNLTAYEMDLQNPDYQYLWDSYEVTYGSSNRFHGLYDSDWVFYGIANYEIINDTHYRNFEESGDLENYLGSLEQPEDIAYCESNQFLYVAAGNRVFGYDTTGTISPFLFDGEFMDAYGITVGDNGLVYVVDRGNESIRVFDLNGEHYGLWGDNGSLGVVEIYFANPIDAAIGPNGSLYIIESFGGGDGGRVFSFSQTPTVYSDELNATDDSDFDGLTNGFEISGWEISITDALGTHVFNVTSNPLLADTDSDGLDDYYEYMNGTNPRDPDSDNDGVSDFDELGGSSSTTPTLTSFQWSFILADDGGMGASDPTNWDSDNDLLGDGTERTYGSSPTSNDTDDEGLSDLTEFLLGSNPNSNDSDDDGLNDQTEFLFNSSLNAADSDGDLMFDFTEFDVKSDPRAADSDLDGLIDGIELLVGTNATSSDTDNDNATDSLELALWLDPNSNDTDGDGIGDMTELELGINPWNNDTDFDGIPDLEDTDSYIVGMLDVVLVSDASILTESVEFSQALDDHTNLDIITSDRFTSNYQDDPFIVLIGRPESGTEGISGLIYELLEDTGEVLARMMTPDASEIVIRHGVWTETQTVIIMTEANEFTVYSVLAALKGRNVTILPNTALLDYSPASVGVAEYSSTYVVDEIDTLKATDSVIAFHLSTDFTLSINITKYNQTTTPHPLTSQTGLSDGYESLGRYLDVGLTIAESDYVDGAFVKIYYKPSDLDANGNGLLDDPEDLNESTLVLYYYNEAENAWVYLSPQISWVVMTGINTIDIEIYGEIYAGFVWAQVNHFSLFGIAGRSNSWTAIPDYTLFLYIGVGVLAISTVAIVYRRKQGTKPTSKKTSKSKKIRKKKQKK
jgi:hypothetical protein